MNQTWQRAQEDGINNQPFRKVDSLIIVSIHLYTILSREIPSLIPFNYPSLWISAVSSPFKDYLSPFSRSTRMWTFQNPIKHESIKQTFIKHLNYYDLSFLFYFLRTKMGCIFSPFIFARWENEVYKRLKRSTCQLCQKKGTSLSSVCLPMESYDFLPLFFFFFFLVAIELLGERGD